MCRLKVKELVAKAHASIGVLPPAQRQVMLEVITRLDTVFAALTESMEQRAALATEVSGITAACEQVYAAGYQAGHLNTADGIAYEVGTKEAFYGLALEVMSAQIETPATDAYLAEVRAQAIRDALDASSDYLDTDCVMDRLDISYEDAELRTSGAIELHDALVAIANELRQGAAQ